MDNDQRVCPKCGKLHDNITWVKTGKIMDKNDVEEIMLINNHIETATQALRPSNIDAGATQDQIDKFILAQNKAKSSYEFLKVDWINMVCEKYKTSRNFDLNWESYEISEMVVK